MEEMSGNIFPTAYVNERYSSQVNYQPLFSKHIRLGFRVNECEIDA